MSRPALGSKHGRLTILEYVSNGAKPQVRVRCECGTEKTVQVANLDRTHSCGCIRREQLTARSITHGMSTSPEFRIWAGMIDRCSRLNSRSFGRYGGRGVTVCQRWLDSFEAFYADMGPRPTPKDTIDRIDNDRGYEPDNCRWATRKEQRINQRRQVLHTHEGITGTAKDLAAHFGANRHTVHDRMWRLHWTIGEAIAAGIAVKRRQDATRKQ